MNRDQKIALTSLVIIIGFVISVIYRYVSGMYLNLPYPLNTFLFRPDDFFTDFIWPFSISANPYLIARADFQNFPLLYRVASIFAIFHLQVALMVFIILFIYGFFMICRVQLNVASRINTYQNAFIFTFMTYPVLIALDRENIEILVFFCLYFFVTLYRKNSFASAILLGLAVALKAFPVILAVLLFSDRRFKEIILAGATALGTTLISYLSYPGGLVINITNHLRNLGLYNATYVTGMEGLSFGNSLYGAIKYVTLWFFPRMVLSGVPPILETIYLIFIFILLALLVVYVLFVEKMFWKKVTLLICAMNLFPFVSGDYKLLHLFIPLFLFLNKDEKERIDLIILLLFSFLLVPKDYLHLLVLPEVSVAVLLNPMAMIALMAIIIVGRYWLPAWIRIPRNRKHSLNFNN